MRHFLVGANTLGPGQEIGGFIAQGARYFFQLPPYIAPDTAHHGFQLLQTGAHALVLFGMGIPSDLRG